MRAEPAATPESSRDSEAGAGWVACTKTGSYEKLMPAGVPDFSWRHPRVLWRSRNDVVARWFGDPSNEIRRRWIGALGERGTDPSMTVHRAAAEFSFLLLGDTGEGDRSQYAVVPPALAVAGDADFMIIASDVIYPVGGSGDYPDKFFRPYAGFPGPIYAVPGNHDWYDGLRGFMRVFCDVETDLAAPPPWRGPFGWLARRVWRRPDPLDERLLADARRDHRPAPGQQGDQPGPYWAIDTPSLRIVGIDTGITGGIDADQAAWLREVSAGPKPKLLVTGKPLMVDGERRPGAIEGDKSAEVDQIVRDPDHHYVAAIGGDIHNYQHYPAPVGDRTIHYIVSGGGGAFMHATHTIPKVDVIDEDLFTCYPLRGDSLAQYSRLYGRWLHMRWLFELTPKQAAAAVARRLGMTPTRPDARTERPTVRARLVAALLGVPRKHRPRPRFLRLPVRKLPQRFRSELADWDRPPFFKSFLRVDVTETELTIRCHGVTGCGEHETTPPVEETVTIPLALVH